MLLSFVTVYAEQDKKPGVSREEVAKAVGNLLLSIEEIKDEYEMDDFSKLYLGRQIPAYFISDDAIILQTNILYFPIMEDRVWKATAVISFDDQGRIITQLSTDYSKVFSGSAYEETEVSLLFDMNSSYLYVNGKVSYIATAPGETRAERGFGISELEGRIKCSNLYGEDRICLVDAADPTEPQRASFNSYCYLTVPNVSQGTNTKKCWAACCVSICGYYGISLTIPQAYSIAEVSSGQGGNVYDAEAVFDKKKLSYNRYYLNPPNWYQLRTEIYSDNNPLYAGCAYSTNSGHAVVIRGYYNNQVSTQLGSITYMNPATGSSQSTAVISDGMYYYVPSGSSTQYQFLYLMGVHR